MPIQRWVRTDRNLSGFALLALNCVFSKPWRSCSNVARMFAKVELTWVALTPVPITVVVPFTTTVPFADKVMLRLTVSLNLPPLAVELKVSVRSIWISRCGGAVGAASVSSDSTCGVTAHGALMNWPNLDRTRSRMGSSELSRSASC